MKFTTNDKFLFTFAYIMINLLIGAYRFHAGPMLRSWREVRIKDFILSPLLWPSYFFCMALEDIFYGKNLKIIWKEFIEFLNKRPFKD